MQLVDQEIHTATSHSGAFAEYLNWVAEVVEGRKLGTLPADQVTGVLKTLVKGSLRDRLEGRFVNEAITIAVKRLQTHGYRVVIREGSAVTAELAGKRVGRSLVGIVLRKGAGPIAAVSVLYAGGKALADGDGLSAAGHAAARDLVMADLIEGAFRLTVIEGTEVVAEALIDPIRHSSKRFSSLSENERNLVQAHIRKSLEEQKSISASTITEEAMSKYGFWELLRRMWNGE